MFKKMEFIDHIKKGFYLNGAADFLILSDSNP
jgi:hypothetical protein